MIGILAIRAVVVTAVGRVRREMGRQLRQSFVAGFAAGTAAGFMAGKRRQPRIVRPEVRGPM